MSIRSIGNIIVKYSPLLLQGVGYTLLVSIIGTIAGLIIGLLIGVYRTMPVPKNKFLKALKKAGDYILNAYIEVFRCTPMMVQAMVIFWGFALLNDGQTLNVIFSGMLIVSINTGAYMAEIVRGGIISIDKGQFEGAYSIGMNHWQTMINVIVPQTMRNILPAISNEFVINIKDTSVLNVIGVTELFFFTSKISKMTWAIFESYCVACVIYFVLTFTITRILKAIEHKIDGPSSYLIHHSSTMPDASFSAEEAR